MSNILGKRIKLLRENKRYSQRELAKILNISNSTLSQYESGNRIPSDDIKMKIADFFQVSIDYLLGATNDPAIDDYIKDLREKVNELGYDISHMSNKEIADLSVKAIKLDEIYKSK